MNRRRGDSPSMRAPSAPRTRVPRTALSLALCLLLPPIGLAYLWRLGVFRPRGRMLLTALATVEMAVFAALMMPRATLESAPLPVPGTPARVTPRAGGRGAHGAVEHRRDPARRADPPRRTPATSPASSPA